MATVTTDRLTAEEFFEWANRPENRDRPFELVRGWLVEMSRPGERHGFICVNIARILGNFTFQRRKGYVCINDTGLVLERDPDTVRGPDVVLFDENRAYDNLDPHFASRLPALAVEVLSPTDKWGKVTQRINQFLTRGIPMVWLVDPEGRNITLYRQGQLPQVVEEDGEITGQDVLPDLRCNVGEMFILPGQGAPQK
jgi:Uma2 family endonuclease